MCTSWRENVHIVICFTAAFQRASTLRSGCRARAELCVKHHLLTEPMLLEVAGKVAACCCMQPKAADSLPLQHAVT